MSNALSKEELIREFEDRLAEILNEKEFDLERHQALFKARNKVAEWKNTQEYYDAVERASKR